MVGLCKLASSQFYGWLAHIETKIYKFDMMSENMGQVSEWIIWPLVGLKVSVRVNDHIWNALPFWATEGHCGPL